MTICDLSCQTSSRQSNAAKAGENAREQTLQIDPIIYHHHIIIQICDVYSEFQRVLDTALELQDGNFLCILLRVRGQSSRADAYLHSLIAADQYACNEAF